MFSVCSAILLMPLLQVTPEVGTGIAPSPMPIAWEITLKFLDPRRIEVQLPGESQPQVYWYMVYTAINRGERTQRFFPTFQIVTEDLRVIDTDLGIHPLVFEAIRERHKITHKYMVSPTLAIGDLRTGEDNALESVAIWRDFDLRLNHFKVYVAGLSGEVKYIARPRPARVNDERTDSAGGSSAVEPAEVAKPVPKAEQVPAQKTEGKPAVGQGKGPTTKPADAAPGETPDKRFIVLRKTLEISYSLPGSPRARPFVEAERGAIRWIMR